MAPLGVPRFLSCLRCRPVRFIAADWLNRTSAQVGELRGLINAPTADAHDDSRRSIRRLPNPAAFRSRAPTGTRLARLDGAGGAVIRARSAVPGDGAVLWKTFAGGWPHVSGLDLTPDGAWLVAGTRSLDESRIRTSDSVLTWQRETQNVNSVSLTGWGPRCHRAWVDRSYR